MMRSITVHATELSSKFDEPQKNETEDFSSDENTDKIRFSVKIKEKLSGIIKKLCTFFDKLRGLPGKFQKLVDGISKKKISLEKTWNSISMFWHDEQNQKAFRLVWKRTKKLVRYILPRKLRGRIHFGFDDPYDTGQVLAAVSPFYGMYARTLTLEPDFTGTALGGELHFKGGSHYGVRFGQRQDYLSVRISGAFSNSSGKESAIQRTFRRNRYGRKSVPIYRGRTV